MRRLLSVLAFSLVFAGISPVLAADVFQISTIGSLLAGGYQGEANMRQVMANGDVGIGTLEGVDGEVVAVDGHAWVARADGSVSLVPDQARTPFMVVAPLRPRGHAMVPAGLDLAALENVLDAQSGNQSRILVVRVDGNFAKLKLRSVKMQQPPYRPLIQVIATDQVVSDYVNLTGTLVGFRFPATVEGVNVPGWHFHFLSADRRVGGHVLGLETAGATARMEPYANLRVWFPANPPPTAPVSPGTAAYGEQIRAVEGGGKR